MTAGCSFTFATAVWMVNWVHDHTANGRTNTAPTHRTSFTDLAQAVLGIADFANGCTAFDMHATNFTGTQTNLSVSTFTRHQHHASAGCTRHLRALTWQHLNAMHDRADR